MIHPHDICDDLEPWTVRITYLARELVEADHEVKLVYHLRTPPENHKDVCAREAAEFETIPSHRLETKLLRRCFEIEKLAGWSDIVHFQKCIPYAAIPAIYGAYYHGRPVHYDWDDWEQKIYEQSHHSRIGSWIFFRQMERHLLRLVDTVSVSSRGLQQLTQKFHFPQERVFYLPVGADLKTFSPVVDGSAVRQQYAVQAKLVIYHGQISGANYVHLYLKAAKIVLSRRTDVAFMVVGGGDRLKEAKRLAGQMGLDGRLVFTGEVPHHKIPSYIAAADVAVACFEDNPQSRCKSPLKVVEYMASGKAVVASRIPEVTHMIGNCGLLVDPENPDQMAQAIATLLDDERLRTHLGGLARERCEQFFNWKRGAETLVKAYRKAIHLHYNLVQTEKKIAI